MKSSTPQATRRLVVSIKQGGLHQPPQFRIPEQGYVVHQVLGADPRRIGLPGEEIYPAFSRITRQENVPGVGITILYQCRRFIKTLRTNCQSNARMHEIIFVFEAIVLPIDYRRRILLPAYARPPFRLYVSSAPVRFLSKAIFKALM